MGSSFDLPFLYQTVDTDVVPTDGLLGWWKADRIFWYDNHSIGFWPDVSGNNFHLTQSIVDSQPVLTSSFVNGKNAVAFSSSFFTFTGSIFKDLTMAEIYAVIKINIDPPVDEPHSGLWGWGADTEITHYPFTNGIILENFGRLNRITTVDPPLVDLSSSFRLYNISSAPSSLFLVEMSTVPRKLG